MPIGIVTVFANDNMNNCDVNNSTTITDSIIAAADSSIPRKSPFTRNRKLKVPWWTPQCRLVLTDRNRAMRVYKARPTQENFILLKKSQAMARRVIKAAKRKSWREYVSRITRSTPSKDVWNMVRAIQGKFKHFGPRYLRIAGRMVTNPRLIANAVGDTFRQNSADVNCSEGFRARKREMELHMPNFGPGDDMPYNRPFEMHELERVLRRVKGTSAGPDNVRYEMIQNLALPDKQRLLDYYNVLWSTRTFPDDWRDAIVLPILKPGKNYLDAGSYRPIALTSCLCKIYTGEDGQQSSDVCFRKEQPYLQIPIWFQEESVHFG